MSVEAEGVSEINSDSLLVKKCKRLPQLEYRIRASKHKPDEKASPAEKLKSALSSLRPLLPEAGKHNRGASLRKHLPFVIYVPADAKAVCLAHNSNFRCFTVFL